MFKIFKHERGIRLIINNDYEDNEHFTPTNYNLRRPLKSFQLR